MTPEPSERVERTDVGASIEVGITRGTGTRDQEKWKLKGKGETAEDAIQELERLLVDVVGTDFESYDADGENKRSHVNRPIGDRIRAFQPTTDDEGGEDSE